MRDNVIHPNQPAKQTGVAAAAFLTIAVDKSGKTKAKSERGEFQ